MKQILVQLVLIVAAAAPHFAGAQQQPLPTLPLSAGIHLIQAEIANTFDARMTGLMHRKKLGANDGMLFVFPDIAPHCMWMKNTFVPLSVAFIDERGVILNIEDMQPQTEESHCARAPARFALEMNQGWFAAKGIKPGAKLAGIEKAPPPR
ncbi:MAG TPA: DUF192 domain-containing protein [Burkholderiales bacterium]|nr:DUF192 domain-containing protein [Burkholderiales bacterium]